MTKYQINLTRIKSSHEDLRTPSVLGWTSALPKIGEPFLLTAEPLDPCYALRIINTSIVQEIREDRGLFWTKYSSYHYEILETKEEAKEGSDA